MIKKFTPKVINNWKRWKWDFNNHNENDYKDHLNVTYYKWLITNDFSNPFILIKLHEELFMLLKLINEVVTLHNYERIVFFLITLMVFNHAQNINHVFPERVSHLDGHTRVQYFSPYTLIQLSLNDYYSCFLYF